MGELDEAILRTVLYGDVFRFPLTVQEIHHFLMSERPCALEDVAAALRDSAVLRARLERRGDWWFLAGRSELADERDARDAASATLWPLACHYGRWLACLPYVRMVAITGALAMKNAAWAGDDLDFVLVTARGRVWLARAFAILVVRLARLRGVTVCPNYVLAESALVQDRQDLYIAHEIAQMVPLAGHAVYAAMRDCNGWTADWLPNATGPFYQEANWRPGRLGRMVQRAAEWALGGRVGDRLEAWESSRKRRRFLAQVPEPGPGARLDAERVKGHFKDHGARVLHDYERRVQAAGLAAEVAAAD